MTKTNLELLWEAEKDLSFDDKRHLEDYLIGALSVLADAQAWQRALDGAVQDHKCRQAAKAEVSR